MVVDNILEFVRANLSTLLKIYLFPGLGFVFGFVIFAVWYQRKYLARIMVRMGPVHCGRRLGWLQLVADALKLLGKELILPRAANKALFILATILLPVIPAAGIALIPFAPGLIIFEASGYGLLLFFALSTLFPVVSILKGWAANNKFTIIGAFRTIYLDLSGEIPVFLAGVGVIIWADTFDLVKIVQLQSNMWFILPQFLGFIVFFIGYLSMIEKVPMDIPTAEPELVLGPNTEYSGAFFLNIMLSDYVNILAWTLLMITLYFGGYNGPPIFADPIFNGVFWILTKLLIAISVVFIIMVTYARMRIDQAVRLGWNYLLPLSIINILLTILLKYFVLGGGV
jgi:NADH-quinone oxidoreductase subunit H